MSVEKRRKTIGVFTPFLQGFYFGELVSQIQQYCHLKGYSFAVIKTDGFGTYSSLMHTAHLDFVITLRNAIHPDLARQLTEQGKPVVSIAYDYFPLDIPIVTSDNDLGIEQAFNYLLSKGHRRFTYIGDLSQYDLRKRYEAFCDQHEINNIPLTNDSLIAVDNTIFSGGYDGATKFHANGNEATGIICGASLTSIGFSQQIANLKDDVSNLTIVGFDAISLVPISEPNMAIVDQNLHLIAYKAINVLEAIERHEITDRKFAIEPKLITPATDFMQAEGAFLATSTELEELHNANYMKSVLSNLYEWPKSIAESNLDTLMTISPLFEKHLKKACYGRIGFSKDHSEYIKITKVLTTNTVRTLEANDNSSISRSAHYPNKSVKISPFLTSSIHIPIYHNGRLWSVLSVYGNPERDNKPSSFSALCIYLDEIVTHLQINLLRQQGASAYSEEGLTTAEENPQGIIVWNLASNETLWDDVSLSILGFESELERNIYQHMDISDRAHSEDESILRQILVKPEGSALMTEIRFKHRNKNYVSCNVSAEKFGNELIQIYLAPLASTT